jgi:hypothetical protein
MRGSAPSAERRAPGAEVRSESWSRTGLPPSRSAVTAAGHEIGVHGRQHRPLLRGPRAPYDDATPVPTAHAHIAQAVATVTTGRRGARGTVADITDTRPTLFRPA